MAYNYETEIEEQDDGYSIPKILVALLLLILIGAGSYIYYQQKKLDTSITYLLNSKKQAEQELNEMIEKYNLAIEDNGSLEGDLIDERDRIVKFRDSIKNIKKEDLKKNTDFNTTISKLKKKSSVESISSQEISSPTKIQANDVVVSDEETNTLNKLPANNTEAKNPITNSSNSSNSNISNSSNSNISNSSNSNISNSSNSSISNSSNNSSSSSSSNSLEKDLTEDKKEEKQTITSFKRIETPPIYPGCKGSIVEKKLCLKKSIIKHLSKKFNTSIINTLNLDSGKKKIWINFDINKNGEVVHVTARAPRNISSRAKKILESEAILTVNKLKKMTPAKQNGKAVNMNYTVPLTISVK